MVPGRRRDRRDRRPAEGQRAGLVHDHGADTVSRLEGLAAADDDPLLGSPAGADHDRRGGGQAHRAGAGDDQHADERGQGVGQARLGAGQEPGDEGQPGGRDDDRDEDLGDPVGRALDRCLGALGPPDELDDPRQGRVTADPRRAHDEGPGDVARRADDRVTRPDRHRYRLAGQHRDVDVGAALDHGAVHRDRVAGPDAEEIADPDGLERDVAVAAVRDEPGGGRAEADQAPDRAGGPDLRPRLQPAAEQDQPDDDRRGIEPGDRLETGGDDDVRGEGDDDAVAPGRGRPDRHQRVHVRGTVPGRPPGRPVEPSPGPELDDRGRQDDEPIELDQGQRHGPVRTSGP